MLGSGRFVSVSDLPGGVPEGVLIDLRQRYAEPQRAYHTWSHIEALLALFSEVSHRLHDSKSVMYGILFHDAVYDPTRGDNEDKSADLLRSLGPEVLDEATKARAVRLVLATKAHAVPSGVPLEEAEDAAIFLDMDLSILAAPIDQFDAYERNIRAEYAHVPDESFRVGRGRVLQEFISRDRLFLSAWGHARFAVNARQNLQRSLQSIG